MNYTMSNNNTFNYVNIAILIMAAVATDAPFILNFWCCITLIPSIYVLASSQPPLNETIINVVPWPVKVLLLRNVDPNTVTKPHAYPSPSLKYTRKPQKWNRKMMRKSLDMNPIISRRVGIEALLQRQADDTGAGVTSGTSTTNGEENNLRLKLFRLMYETVRDSDLKIKRAELIRKHYINSTAWEIGYLMGEVQEKHDLIIEFAATLEKFYHVWKPIEHINAYEQIATYAVQITYLVDLIKTISKTGSIPHPAMPQIR